MDAYALKMSNIHRKKWSNLLKAFGIMLFNYLSFFALITKLKNLNKLQELEMS